MKTLLRPCTRCDRHYREHERSCPFCGTARPAAPTAGAGATRSALLAAGAVLALGAHEIAAPLVAVAQDDAEDAVRLTPQYGAPDYQPDPPPPPPPPPPRSANERDAGPPRPPAPTSELEPSGAPRTRSS